MSKKPRAAFPSLRSDQWRLGDYRLAWRSWSYVEPAPEEQVCSQKSCILPLFLLNNIKENTINNLPPTRSTTWGKLQTGLCILESLGKRKKKYKNPSLKVINWFCDLSEKT